LESLKKRYNIVFGTMRGERGIRVRRSIINKKQHLAFLSFHLSIVFGQPRFKLIRSSTLSYCDYMTGSESGLIFKAIFNMDETILIYRSVSKNTLKVKGDECAGGKCSKERITPLVIGKARQPRCFSKIKPDSLPVM
jgi:hypothetical protein